MRQKHKTGVYECCKCGFLFFEHVFWLQQACACAINPTDVGYVSRNISPSTFLASLLEKISTQDDLFIDYGERYGMLVRLMRDRGFRFHWSDPHCENLFTKFSEAPKSCHGIYRALTAVEVLEHLTEPRETVRDMLEMSRTILFTTELVPAPQPCPEDWWYFGLDHGQHVAFYTVPALQGLAASFGLRYRHLQGHWHAFCPATDNLMRWRRASKLSRLFSKVSWRSERPSLLAPDYEKASELIKHSALRLHQNPSNVDNPD